MFKKRIVSVLFIWLLMASGTGWFFHSSPPRAQRTYQRLMDYSDLAKNNPKVFKAEQRRTDVSKQIIFLQDSERLQWRLQSASSELSFDQQDEGLELIERFKDVNCIMQEKLTTGSQFVRSLVAEEATYHYKKEEMLADQALIARYEIPGRSFVNSLTGFVPFMEGKAGAIELSFKKNHLFKAQKFQATFNDLEKGL